MITREQMVTESVQRYAAAALTAHGYLPTEVTMLESFPYSYLGELTTNLVATGFDFDNEGTQAELGSDLKVRLYTVSFFVFGKTQTWAKNIANAIKFALDAESTIPLLDITAAGQPEIDRLVLIGVSAERQIITDPDPFQQHVWSTTARVEDTYYARLAS
jgi:hypothetical protein